MSTGAAPEWLARARGGAAASDAPTTDAARAPMRARRRPTSTSGALAAEAVGRARSRGRRTRSPSRGMTCRHARVEGRERTDADATVQDGTQLRHVARKTTRSFCRSRRPKAIFSLSVRRARRGAHAVRELARRAGVRPRARSRRSRFSRRARWARALPETAPVRRRPPRRNARRRPRPPSARPRSSACVLTSVDLARWIEARGADVELVRCEGDDTPDVASSAAALGVDVSQIVKSLGLAADGAFVVVVSNGETRVDVKKLARALGVANRRVRLATPERPSSPPASCPGRSPCSDIAPLRTAVDAVPLVPGGVVFEVAETETWKCARTFENLRLTNAELGPQGVPEEVPKPRARKNTPREEYPGEEYPEEYPGEAYLGAGSNRNRNLAEARFRVRQRVGTERRPLSRDVEVLGDAHGRSHRGGECGGAADPVAVRGAAGCSRPPRRATSRLRHAAPPRRAGHGGVGRARPRRAPSVRGHETNAGSRRRRRGGFPLAAGTEFQRSRTFSHGASRWRVRDGDGAARARQGDVVEVEGRSANPRPMTVDIVARSMTRGRGRRGRAALARADAEDAAA